MEYEALTSIKCLDIIAGDKLMVNQISKCGSLQQILHFKMAKDLCPDIQDFFSEPLDIGLPVQQGDFLVTRLF